jgi:hypothetical protein
MVNERLTRDNRKPDQVSTEMRMGQRWLAAALGFAVFGLAAQATAGPAVATRWQKVAVSQDECLQKAEDTIRKSGFGKLERTQQSRYGSLDKYTVAIRCITSNGLAIFIVSGPSRGQSDKMAGVLFENWE